MTDKNNFNIENYSCPFPITDYPRILLAHGGGGRLMNNLIQKMFLSVFNNNTIPQPHDGAVFSPSGSQMAFTTDSYVINPLFFPGGDIGSLAVHGTVNDISMCGAVPEYLSASFIIEEGLEMDTLWKIVLSMKKTADDAGVRIVTGDTKVVEKQKGDGIYINTAGVGTVISDTLISPSEIQPGDAIIINGDIGRHGIAIMSVRENLEFEYPVLSDCASLNHMVKKLIEEKIRIRCMRDLTRGGLSSAMIEIAETANLGIELNESAVKVTSEVASACEILGFDSMYVANEGRFALFIHPEDSEKAMKIMKSFKDGSDASLIGKVTDDNPSEVMVENQFGIKRVLSMLSGEQLPRIC